MTWTIWATCPTFRHPVRFIVPAPSALSARDIVLGSLRHGLIIDCTPEAPSSRVRL